MRSARRRAILADRAKLTADEKTYRSSGKKKPRQATQPQGKEIQEERQQRDDELRELAGQRSGYVHQSTLSRPFGGSTHIRSKAPKRYDPTDRKELRRLEGEKRRRHKNKKKTPARPPLPDGLRLQILARDDYRCRYCGQGHEHLHADHVIPYSQGGQHEPDNLVTACQPCNLRKGTQTWVPCPLDKHLKK